MNLSGYKKPEWYSFEYLSECVSTNDEAFARGDRHIVVAGHQTGARGRMGRTYSAEEGGLYVSVCVAPPCEMKDAPALAALAALAAKEAISDSARIKWPNDILMNGKKVCGILSEARQGLLVFGFGINIDNQVPDDIPNVGFVEGKAEEILQKLTDKMAEIVAGYPANREELMQQYAFNCCTLGNNVSVIYRGMPVSGMAFSVDKHGGLMIMPTDSRTVIIVYSGEATILKKEEIDP